jgi:hypothetical protein
MQSGSSRSHYQNSQFVSRLGEVDEYNRTEAIIGFAPEKKRKTVLSELKRRNSFRVEIESGTRQRRISPVSEPPIFITRGTTPASVSGVGKSPILVEDHEPKEVVELSQALKAPQGRTRNATPRPAASKAPASAEKSQYFTKPEKRSIAKSSFLHTGVSSASSGSVVEALEREEAGSPSSFYSLDNAAYEVQDVEDDSVDLVKPDGDDARVDQKAQSRARVHTTAMKPFASPKSKSISEEGDIPQSTFLGTRPRNQSQSSRMLKSELSFGITYMQSGQKGFKVADDCEAWKLQYDLEKKEFNVIANDESLHELYPGLVLKPEKIHVVKYSNDSSKVVISRAMETSIGAAAQVLVKMDKLRDGNRLAQSLKKLNHTIKLSPVGRLALFPSKLCSPTDRLHC